MHSQISDSELNMARRQLSVNEKTWIIKHMYRLEFPLVRRSIG